jgi:hypothetical protein
MFTVLAPAALAATAQALGEAEQAHATSLRAFTLAVERARFDADRARRQYDAVEPRTGWSPAPWNEPWRPSSPTNARPNVTCSPSRPADPSSSATTSSPGSGSRDELTDTAADAAIEAACRILRLPTIREHHTRIAEAATRQKAGYKGFLVELLAMECDEREDRRKTRLTREAGFPRPKRIDDFDFTLNPLIDPGMIHTLARGAWIRSGQPVCLIGDSGIG